MDLITINRKTFLDLIAAAELARCWMANRAPCEPFANNTRQSLHNALANAVAEPDYSTKDRDRDGATGMCDALGIN